jgi:thioesterase domain-containing protein
LVQEEEEVMNEMWPAIICAVVISLGTIVTAEMGRRRKDRQEAEKKAAKEARYAKEHEEYLIAEKAREARIKEEEAKKAVAEAALRTWVVAEEDMENILYYADELTQNRNGANHYRLWSEVNKLFPETKGLKAGLSFDGMKITIKEVL